MKRLMVPGACGAMEQKLLVGLAGLSGLGREQSATRHVPNKMNKMLPSSQSAKPQLGAKQVIGQFLPKSSEIEDRQTCPMLSLKYLIHSDTISSVDTARTAI